MQSALAAGPSVRRWSAGHWELSVLATDLASSGRTDYLSKATGSGTAARPAESEGPSSTAVSAPNWSVDLYQAPGVGDFLEIWRFPDRRCPQHKFSQNRIGVTAGNAQPCKRLRRPATRRTVASTRKSRLQII